jgi:hypothetical protein
MFLGGRVNRHAFLGEDRRHPFGRPGALGRVIDARQRLERNAVLRSGRQAAAEIMPVAPIASAAVRIEPPKSKAKIWLPR